VTEKQVFSLWDVLFSGGIIGNTIMIAIFLWDFSIYVFSKDIFSSKERLKKRLIF
jgi:biopolymer transport protein ExbB